MADVWLGRYSRYLEKLFNIKGGPAVVDVSPSIASVLLANAPPLEERYLVGLESFAVGGQQAAVAGNKSAVMIRNPTGSGVIAVIEKIMISSATAGPISIHVAGSNPADLANGVSNHSRADPRSRNISSCIVTQDAPAVDPGTGFLQLLFVSIGTTATDLILVPNQEIVLLPQIAMRVINQTINTALNYGIFYRERPLESSELN